MQKKRDQHILFFIAIVSLITIGIQLYWNYKNYKVSEQQLINDVQIGLDNAVNYYYEKIAKDNTLDLATSISQHYYEFSEVKRDGSHQSHKQSHKDTFPYPYSPQKHYPNLQKNKKLNTMRVYTDSSLSNMVKYNLPEKSPESTSQIKFITIPKTGDTIIEIEKLKLIEAEPIKELASKILISVSNDNMNIHQLDSLLKHEFSRKQITVDYSLTYNDQFNNQKIIPFSSPPQKTLTTSTTSLYLPYSSTIGLSYTNTTTTLLKKNLLGILLSFILIATVIYCMLYLLRIINRQKQLAEVKNDLISNITHEFKTPITTINAALEGISLFNKNNNPEKTKKYVTISFEQLQKLNLMVEKILETASLDSDKLQLNKERIELVSFMNDCIAKHQHQLSQKKKIQYLPSSTKIYAHIDIFHIENAINNIIDNAIKYGGNEIHIAIKDHNNQITIQISDNGSSLSKAHKDKIFEKFYRVPKGNTHDVKGFGIGLFYTKTIIEKHQGTITATLDHQMTNFIITLPNE
ncbi:sensor histidine kinase [Aquimarina hainanensis]|uniref:histidine kinase n=1 Tax=Aquimarina hainanensis TaxID=1578017 RepID=A0ABW5NAU5_9FLAO